MVVRLVLVTLLSAGFLGTSLADIQDPPAADYGPTRKLGRGVANVLFGWSEVPVTIGRVNHEEGNAAAGGYGVVKGTGRAFARFGVGLYETLLWPIPVYKNSYRPILPNEIPWLHRGYSEFPPELGNESKYSYVRDY